MDMPLILGRPIPAVPAALAIAIIDTRRVA
jgi:hypothetical protein